MGRVRTGSVRERTRGYQLAFWYQGKRCFEPLHLKPSKSNKRYAERYLARVVDAIERGTFSYREFFPDSDRSFGVDDPVVKDALNEYLRNLRVSKATYVSERSYIERHLIPSFGDKHLSEITIEDVESWARSLKASRATAKKVLRPLSIVLRRAVVKGVIPNNPVEYATIHTESDYKPKQRKIDPFTPSEQRAILDACMEVNSSVLDESGRKQLRNLFQTWMWTGMRKSEIYALRWEDVDFDNGSINVNRALVCGETKETKTEAGQRSIEMTPRAREALESQHEYTSDNEIVFPNPNTGSWWRGPAFFRLWYQILDIAQVRYRAPNNCRHTFASMLLSSSDPKWNKVPWVARQLGHSPANTGTVHAHYASFIEDMRDDDDFVKAANEQLQEATYETQKDSRPSAE